MARSRKPRNRPRPRHRSAGRSKGASNAVWGIALVAMIVGTFAGGIWVVNFLSDRPTYDVATLCPSEGPTGAMIVLLDLTDPLSRSQAMRLTALLESRIDKAAAGTMISLGVVSEFEDRWGAHFALCKPESGAAANTFYQNPALIAQAFRTNFQEPLTASIAEMMQATPENRSPIIEALQSLIAETPQMLDLSGPVRIIIASDMLQHSDNISFYRGEGWNHLESSGGVTRLAKSLEGSGITLVRIPRPEAGSRPLAEIEPFWARYFDRQGAAAPFDIISLGDL